MPDKKQRNFDLMLGARLRTLRRLQGMTQQELGAQLGVSFQQVQKYERGLNSMSAARLLHLCEIFGVSVENGFWTDPEGERPILRDLRQSHDRQALSLLSCFRRIENSRNRGLLCELAAALVQASA